MHANDTPQLPLFTIISDDLPPIVPITSPKVKDWTGRVFGRLTVLGFGGPDQHWRSRWVCQCSCGKYVVAKASGLKRGDTQSCGCLHSDITAKRNRTHGLSQAPEYSVWNSMVTRCENPKSKYYKNYGGRGIAICNHWRENFANFLNDLGPRSSPKHTIDRIDTNAHYSCGHCDQCKRMGWTANCQWSTWAEQQNNKRSNHFLDFQGERLTLSQWSDRTGIHQDVLFGRLDNGWSTERTLTTPVAQRTRYLSFQGERMNIAQWTRKMGMAKNTLIERLNRGWSVERALTTPVK